ncbi:MAG: BON domain-containing protein [Thermoanaerobaculia bacterium]|nr:BON domain-containing protein [Thermoanaerobaculia bacterium]
MSSNRRRAVLCALAVVMAWPAASPAEDLIEKRRLENRIRQTLIDRLGEDARPIQVAINGKKAFLSGTVDERVTQELAKEVVLTFSEVVGVTNRIEARKARRLDQGQAFEEGTDAELEIRVRRAISAALGAQSKSLQIEVVDRVVSLRGTLPDVERKVLALATAKDVETVRDILDLIRTVR